MNWTTIPGNMIVIEKIREEITSYISEYLEEYGNPNDINQPNMKEYIEKQVMDVVDKMYSGPIDDDTHPSNIDLMHVEGDYYRESIYEYGTVYDDYRL